MARLEGAYEQVSQRLMNIDPRFDALDRKIDLLRDSLDKKIEALDAKTDQRFDALEQRIDAKIDQRFMWTVGIIVTTWLTTMGTMIASIYLHH
jgi:hypothetical protein